MVASVHPAVNTPRYLPLITATFGPDSAMITPATAAARMMAAITIHGRKMDRFRARTRPRPGA